jgi:UDP-N-acetylmuramyl tripeptide synthase
MFDMFRSDETDVKTQEDMEQIISKLNCIKILVTDDDPATPAPVDLYQEIMKLIPSSPYKEIMVVKEKDQNIKFFAREEKNKVVELLMTIGGKEENVLISIQGITI